MAHKMQCHPEFLYNFFCTSGIMTSIQGSENVVFKKMKKAVGLRYFNVGRSPTLNFNKDY